MAASCSRAVDSSVNKCAPACVSVGGNDTVTDSSSGAIGVVDDSSAGNVARHDGSCDLLVLVMVAVVVMFYESDGSSGTCGLLVLVTAVVAVVVMLHDSDGSSGSRGTAGVGDNVA
ncbi:hypothetical protein NDU88_000873 [Pleurodeles waltl]|uniref:Uncharacterized protein n=1 Tax=Pleurodeles waltl TaxID=8319 RepID=A0AAV7WK97_PLEWA|nr:hypothetical protein NDU88_000873 [Pleurodeles waltl]